MALSGAWIRQAFYTDPAERLHVADPAHGVREPDDPGTAVYDAPPGLDPGVAYLESPPVWGQVVTAGMVTDEPPEDHESTPHTVSTGGDQVATAADPQPQFSSERYLASRFPGLPSTPVSRTALVRGLNSQAENNPEGFDRGHVEQHWVDRKLYYGRRTGHDQRWLLPNVADVGTDTPPVPTPWGSPYSDQARAITRTWQYPTMRREPQPWDQAVTGDGAVYPADSGSWVAG